MAAAGPAAQSPGTRPAEGDSEPGPCDPRRRTGAGTPASALSWDPELPALGQTTFGSRDSPL